MAYLKPQSPIKLNEDHIYPLTTADQIIMEDGSRWDGGAETDVKIATAQASADNARSLANSALSQSGVTSVNGAKGDVTVAATNHTHNKLDNGYVLEWTGDHMLHSTDRADANLHFGSDALLYRNNNSAYYKIYDTGNKPTYSDVGAAAASHTHSYMPLSGGTLNGNLTINRSTTIADNTPAGLYFQVVQTDNNTTSKALITVYDDHDASASGTTMVQQSSGNMIIGAGESPAACYTTDLVGNKGENLYLTSDSAINFYSNANTYANKKVATFNTSGVFNAPTLAEGGTNIANTYVKKTAFSLSGTTLTITTT